MLKCLNMLLSVGICCYIGDLTAPTFLLNYIYAISCNFISNYIHINYQASSPCRSYPFSLSINNTYWND